MTIAQTITGIALFISINVALILYFFFIVSPLYHIMLTTIPIVPDIFMGILFLASVVIGIILIIFVLMLDAIIIANIF